MKCRFIIAINHVTVHVKTHRDLKKSYIFKIKTKPIYDIHVILNIFHFYA